MRLPTEKQATLLETLTNHPAQITNGRITHTPPPGSPRLTKTTLTSLAKHRWVTADDADQDGEVTTTGAGRLAVQDRRDHSWFLTGAPMEAGIHIVSRSGSRGLNVTCSACHTRRVEEAAGTHQSPRREVWFTNEPNDRRSAEIAAGRHHREHTEDASLPPLGQG